MAVKGKQRSSLRSGFEEKHTNRQTSLDLEFIEKIKVNTSAVERRTATLQKRRSVKKEYQLAWLIQALQCIDLTSLAGDDTEGRILRLCAKAKNPIRLDILEMLEVEKKIQVGAVCVYQNRIETAVNALKGTSIPVAAVSTGFPAGMISHEQKIAQIKSAVRSGAKEIDIVISRPKAILNQWQELYEEIVEFKKACGKAHMKTILATGELPDLAHVAKASHVCMMAGADFIKTSTGKEKVNANLEVSLIMVRAIREHYERTGYKVGFKPAGGIQTAKQSLAWLILMKEELDESWMRPELFRFGASSLLGDIERQIEHSLKGRYAASYRNPIA